MVVQLVAIVVVPVVVELGLVLQAEHPQAGVGLPGLPVVVVVAGEGGAIRPVPGAQRVLLAAQPHVVAVEVAWGVRGASKGVRDASKGVRDASKGWDASKRVRDASMGVRGASKGWDASRGVRDASKGVRDASKGLRDGKPVGE